MPRSNEAYWQPKLLGNIDRDRRSQSALESLGWKVLIAWECEIRRDAAEIARNLRDELINRCVRKVNVPASDGAGERQDERIQ